MTITSGEPRVLDFHEYHLPVVVEQEKRITKSEAQGLPVPSVLSVSPLLEQYDRAIEERDRARDDYLRLVNQVDEAVFDVFDMPDHLRRVVGERMSEFPLNEHAAKYRKPWEPTRPPQIQLFEPSERYF